MPATPGDAPRFEDITETTGGAFTREAAGMMQTRYDFAVRRVAGRRVLELGCGAGQGFGLMQRGGATQVVGGDYSMALLRSARRHYQERVPLVRLSATDLPLRAGSFDVVVFYEATYYVPDMEASFREIARVLAPAGALLIVNANPERPDFIRSPHSTHYHSADEFRAALERQHFAVEVSGAYPVVAPGDTLAHRASSAALRGVRTVLEAFGLVPKTLKGRARLKRLLYGKLTPVPAELTAGFAPIAPLAPVGPGPVTGYKVLYVTATCASG